MIDRQKLIEIVDLGNSLKSTIIILYKNHIIGTDENTTYFKVLEYGNNIDSDVLVYLNLEMREFIKPLTVLDSIEIKGDKAISSTGTEVSIYDDNVLYRVINYLSNINSTISNSKVDYHKDELEKDKEFIEMINYKTDHGISFYKISKDYILTVYKNLLPVNKADKISLDIYNHGYGFLCRFTVYKSKLKTNISVYIMYLHI